MIRHIDNEKCIGCGTCQKVCPLDVFRMSLEQPAASPCAAACPIHHNINEYHYLLQMGDVEGAARSMWRNNPLAAISARVCPHYCEAECSRKSVDSAVNIGGIEQFLGDYALTQEHIPNGKSHLFPVAVVGSGPSGLTCAAFLAEEGFKVTMFEELEEPGGMLRYGVPEHRLPSSILEKLITKLRFMGVHFETGQRLGRDFLLPELKQKGFGAVYLAIGASKACTLEMEGVNGPGVLSGLDFLRGVRTRRIRSIDGRALVVGGGDVAMDVAESLIRLGCPGVTVAALETENQLPALRRNMDGAKNLGAKFLFSTGIGKIIREGDSLKGAELIRCIRVFDENGSFAPQFDNTRSQRFEAELIVLAIGQTSDLDCVPEKIRLNGRLIAADKISRQTAMHYVFSGGDVATGPRSVAEAIAGGKQAAAGIALYLRGGDLTTLKGYDAPVFKQLENIDKHRRARRCNSRPMTLLEGSGSPPDAPLGFGMLEALAESNRCLTCGAKAGIAYPDDCMTCFSCELNCPQDAIYVSPIKEEWPKALAPLPVEK